jgi:pentalenene oxygenase
MSEQINQVVGRWGDGEILNLRHQMDEMAAAVLLSTLFRTGIDEGRRARIRADLQAIFTGIYWRMMMPTALTRAPTPGNRRYQLARNRLRRLLDQLIEERMSSSTPGDDLIGRLVAARDTEGDGQGLSLQELVDQSLSIYAAGVETMATTLSWACHLLSRNPDMQERLYDEAAAALAGRTLTWTDLPDLPYCRQTLMETLRLYPAGWLFTRIATQDTTLGTHPIREGTVLAYSPYLLGHRDSLYPDPERFDPGRWNERLHAGAPRHGFVAFGGGARKCLGDEFAMIEGTLALAAITTRWRLHPQPGTGPRPRVRSTLQPRALRIRVTARDA